MNLPLRSGTMLRLIALALLLAQPAAAQPVPTVPAPEAAAPAVAAPVPDAAVPPGDPATLLPVEAALPHDLSPWGMFAAADPIVKGVMIGLALASLLTWTVWLAKTLQLAQARRRHNLLRRQRRHLEGQRIAVARDNEFIAAVTEPDL